MTEELVTSDAKAGTDVGETKEIRRILYTPTFLALDQIVIGDRFRQSPLVGIDSLMRSIERVGLLHAVVVREEDNLLIAGQRRVEAYRQLRRTKIPARLVANLEDGVLLAQQDENTERVPLTRLEALALAEAIRPRVEAEAKERQREGGRHKHAAIAHKLVHTGRTRDIVAAAAEMSPRTLDKVRAVKKAGRPELVEQIKSSGNVDAAFKKLRRKRPLGARIRVLDGKLARLIPDIEAVVKSLPGKTTVPVTLIAQLTKHLTRIGDFSKKLQASAAIPKPTGSHSR
jgi:ParB-like chromosome segregation protein Spo0J